MNTNSKRRSRLAKVYTVKIREDIAKMIERANHFALPERQVTLQTAIEVANRDLRRTVEMHPDRRAFSALKAVSAHIALATNNKYTSASLSNSDLLPVGHPMSTAVHAMTASALAHAQARWISADRLIADDARALVASAYSLEPESFERRHAFARLAATPTTSVPRMLTLDPLTAAFGFGLGGDSKAARSLRAHLQRRDRYGRFAFMGGGFSFNLRGLDGMFSKFGGRVVGAGGDNTVEVEVRDHSTVPNGIYSMPAGKGVSSKAWLPESVDVKDSDTSTDLFVDESSLQKLDAPSGWNKQPTEAGAPELWTSKDGYFVTKDGDTLSLNRANSADNSIGEQVASSDSWADIQKAALGDQDDYEKSLKEDEAFGPTKAKAPESKDTGALRAGEAPEGWTTKELATTDGVATAWRHTSPDGKYFVTEDRNEGLGAKKSKAIEDRVPNFAVVRRNEDGSAGKTAGSFVNTWGGVAGRIKADSMQRDKEAPDTQSALDFISPEEGRTVLDDGLSKVESALGDISNEDLDNLDGQDSEALNKVNDLLDSAQEAIDSIDPVGSDTNDLRFDQARADLGEIAQILSESNNGDMQNAGFDLKEKIDEFINLPQIDFGGGRAERASRETPAPEVKATVPTLMPGDDGTPDDAATRNLPTAQDYMDDPAIDAQIKSMDSYLSEEFDAMFETPDGAYKPDIFSAYEPKGKTIEDSADYTDDPEVLAGMFSDQELVLALRDAVLPLDGEDAPGRGALEFSDGPEFVPAEALYLAIDKKSGKGDMSLASIYDMELDPNREMTNADRIAMFEEDAKIDPLGGNEIKMPTTRDAEVLKAVDRNKEIGKPTKAQRATDLMLSHNEQNQSIIDIADDLIAKQDDGLGYDSFNLQDTLVQYLPWSVSNDPNEREAFKALWGMMMSLDGGSSNEELTPESLADPEAFRTIIYNSLLEIHGGDDTIAMDSYNELVDNFGGMPEFVAGKEAIANGKADLSSDSTAAAFYRLVATSSKPNEKSIYRSIAVRNDDPLLEKYTTEGSLFGMDARSFTSTNITDGSLSSKLFYPAGSGESRIIFEIAPGETKSIDASTISWFAGENEHFSFGNFEVVSVKKQEGLGKNPEYVVKVRNTDTKDVAAPIAEGISYSGIEDWKKVGGQMGSNVGGTFEDPNGNQYYVKIPKSPSHAQNESLASALYREAGIEAVEVNLGFSDGELRTISPLIPNSSTDLQTKLDDAEYMKKLQEGFAVDAWLANWDVAGLTFDNVITDGNGNPVRVDPGGALMWRAQGAPKGKLFGDKVNEIDSLRDPDLNPTSAEVFGSMTDADISDSAAKLAGITPERIDSIVDSIVTDPNEAATLKERLKKRRDDILKRFAPKDKILNENTPLPVEEDPNAPQPPADTTDVNAMNEYKGALADYEINKAVSDVWDCPPGGLTAAGDKTCTTPSVDDLIDNVTSKVDAVGVVDNSATAEKILDDVIDFVDQVQSEQLKPSTKKKAQDIADEITAIREGIKDGSITNDEAIARLNTLSDSIPVGGTSADADTLEVIGESIDDYRRILDGSFEDRPMSKDYPPAGSGSKGYAKDKTTFLTIGKRVRNKWGYAGVVDRYDKNSWQVWVTMDIDPSGQFAPGYKKMSFSTKTLDVIPEGGDDSPWIDLPGTPDSKKPKTGITPTKLPPKGSPGEKYSKEVADKIAKSGKAAKPPKAEAPQGAPEVPEVKPEVPSAPEVPSVPETSAVLEPTVTMKGKVTGTGMPKITVKEPLSFDYTAYKDIPSLNSSIASLSDTNVQFAKVRGSSALFDSGDIEDLEVRIEGIVDEKGNEHMRVTYKLTSWAGDNLVKSMETEGTWDSKSGINIPRTSVDPATGAILVKTSVYPQYGGSGTTYTADLGDTTVTLRRASEKKNALHNYVTIDLPYGASNDDIKSAMEVGGITDVRPATSTDFTVLAENRLMSIFGSHTDASKNLKLPSVREKTLSDIESKYGITASDVFVTVGPGGQIETRIPDAVAQKIAEKTGAKYLIHNFNMTGLMQTAAANKGITDTNALSPGQREQLLVEGIVDFLTGARGGGLMSTRTRWFNGLPLTGMSSDSDMKTGGADYVFFTPKNSIGYKHSSGTYGNSEAELMFDAAKLYTRLDWYANYNDEYGKRGASKDVIENARVGAYEVMFKKRVGLDSLESMAINRQLRDSVLAELDKQGIKEIHGKPVAEAIVIAGAPSDPTGAELAQYTPLNNTVAYLTSKMQMEKMGYIEQQKYLNSVFDYKYTYPPTTTNVIAAKPDLSSLLTVDGISGVYYYYNADGTRTQVKADEVQGIINSLGKDGSDLKVFKLTPLSSMETIKNEFAKYQSGEITAEQFANALIAAQWGAPTWSASVEINSILKSNPEVWDLFKKIVKGSK